MALAALAGLFTEANMDIAPHEKSELLALALGSTVVQFGIILVIWQALFS